MMNYPLQLLRSLMIPTGSSGPGMYRIVDFQSSCRDLPSICLEYRTYSCSFDSHFELKTELFGSYEITSVQDSSFCQASKQSDSW